MPHLACLVRTAGLLLLAAASAAAQRSLLVPSQYKTIQAAIDAASDQDSVWVDPGVYRETLDFKGKKIRVQSTHGPEQTIVDGGAAGSVVRFATGETRDALFSSFTITHGTGTADGFLKLGGGIFCRNASPFLVDLIVEHNVAAGGFGYGGGIYVEGGEPFLIGCTMRHNTASHAGGGIHVVDSTAVISRCRFIANQANLGGGALLSRGCPIVSSSAFLGNTARAGGGIYAQLDLYQTKTFTNNTVVENSAEHFGGGFASASDRSEIENCIFWNNACPLGAELAIARDCSICAPSRVTIANCVVKGGLAGVWVADGATLAWGAGMLDADPKLHDVARADVHLEYGSPCRDRGNGGAKWLPTTDLDDDPRVVGHAVDIGADEFAPRFYQEGRAVRGGSLQLRVVGPPDGAAAWAFSAAMLATPLPLWGLGDLHLNPNLMVVFPLPPLPASGVLPFSVPLPRVFPVTAIPTQALAGTVLTNPVIVHFFDPP
ncbi:MAG: right-handed parallel beta-helix repeat-containing protein [Planctomycetes bacterium]|nr:right-handed parallel beta-helix repeat-containing protein [Planctomycetota bacterium]